MRNRRGMTIKERITKDIELAEKTADKAQRQLLAYMAVATAEFAIDFNLITYQEWDELTQKAFATI